MLGINTVGIVPLARPKAHLGGALLSVDAKNLVTFRQTKNAPPGKPWKNHGKRSAIQCPLFWALSKVRGILVTIKCIVLGAGFLRVFVGLYRYLRHCYENFGTLASR